MLCLDEPKNNLCRGNRIDLGQPQRIAPTVNHPQIQPEVMCRRLWQLDY
jgi:hypothetical protein